MSERVRRVAALVHREMARLIASELTDPRVTLATVTAVKLSRDLRVATVYVRGGEGEGEGGAAGEGVVEALRGADKFLRREMARRLNLRVTPELRFHLDRTPERGARLARLIEDAVG